MENTPVLISVSPNLRSELGHEAGYAKAMSEALTTISWRHVVLVPRDCAVPERPANWLSALPARSGRLGAIVGWLPLAFAIRRSISGVRREAPQRRTVLLMESFTVLQLLALAVAATVPWPRSTKICLLYRNTLYVRPPVGSVHKFIATVLEKVFRMKVVLLTDSTLLELRFRDFFRRSVHTLPIPHTSSINHSVRQLAPSEEIVCWWPGSPRAHKGLETIRALVRLPGESSGIALMASRLADLHSIACSSVRLVEMDDPLSEREYAQAMDDSTAVLLPYDPEVYRDATSGIFVEAICAGKIPFVSRGTWMAHELEVFSLGRLVLNWSSPNLLAELRALVADEALVARLGQMRDHYRRYHNPVSYGASIGLAVAGVRGK